MVEGMRTVLSGTPQLDKRSADVSGNIRIMILVHSTFANHSTLHLRNPSPPTTAVHVSSSRPSAAHDVKITEGVDALHTNGCVGAHTARRPGDNPPVRRARTQK
jgi:hypothetical protein